MSTLTSSPGKSPFAGSGDRNGLMTYTSMDSSNGGGGDSRNGSCGRNGSAVAGVGAAVAMGDYREDRHDLLLSPRSSRQSEYNPNETFKRPTGMLYWNIGKYFFRWCSIFSPSALICFALVKAAF